jgi:hypothetical protein
MNIGEVLAWQLEGTRDWTLKLLADLKEHDLSFQPGPGLAHIRYLMGHLAVSQDVLIHVRCLGKGIVPADFAAHFPIGAAIKSTEEHDYPPENELRKVMTEVQARTLAAVRAMPETLLREPAFGKDGAPHPHYTDKLGAVSHCDRHEAFHAGQIATIRRLVGKSFLR